VVKRKKIKKEETLLEKEAQNLKVFFNDNQSKKNQSKKSY